MSKCIKCKDRETIEFEDIGKGKFCQECLDEENKEWEREC